MSKNTLLAFPETINIESACKLLESQGYGCSIFPTQSLKNGPQGFIFINTANFGGDNPLNGIGEKAFLDRFEAELAKKIDRLRKKKWSPSKISRWEAEVRANSLKHKIIENLNGWINFLQNSIKSLRIKEIGVLIFWNTAKEEYLIISGIEKRPLSGLNKEALLEIQYDTLHIFKVS